MLKKKGAVFFKILTDNKMGAKNEKKLWVTIIFLWMDMH